MKVSPNNKLAETTARPLQQQQQVIINSHVSSETAVCQVVVSAWLINTTYTIRAAAWTFRVTFFLFSHSLLLLSLVYLFGFVVRVILIVSAGSHSHTSTQYVHICRLSLVLGHFVHKYRSTTFFVCYWTRNLYGLHIIYVLYTRLCCVPICILGACENCPKRFQWKWQIARARG